MSATKQIDYRIVICVPRHPWIGSADTAREAQLLRDHCEDIVSAIRGVVEHVSRDSDAPRIESTTVCKFCEYPWESACEENGKPACCQKAIDQWETNHPDSQQFGAGA